MTLKGLAAAQNAYPVGTQVRFMVYGNYPIKRIVGVVIGHRDTARGSFVLVQDKGDHHYAVRPARVFKEA
jgi:hypothetical protein